MGELADLAYEIGMTRRIHDAYESLRTAIKRRDPVKQVQALENLLLDAEALRRWLTRPELEREPADEK